MMKYTCVVVVEEGVEPGTIDEDVGGLEDAKTPCVAGGCLGRVVKRGDGGEGATGSGVGLVVSVRWIKVCGQEDICNGGLTVSRSGSGP